jgi:hypothetical protein
MKTMELTDEEVEMVEAKRESEKYAKTYTKRGILKHDLYCFDYDKYNVSESASWTEDDEAFKTKKDIEDGVKIVKDFSKKFKDFHYLAAKKGAILINKNGAEWVNETETEIDIYVYDEGGKWAERHLTNITEEEIQPTKKTKKWKWTKKWE